MTIKWNVSISAQKQSNYGRYKAGLYRGEGRDFETVSIVADTPERALEIARNAAIAEELLSELKILLHVASKNGWPVDILNDARIIIAKAEGK